MRARGPFERAGRFVVELDGDARHDAVELWPVEGRCPPLDVADSDAALTVALLLAMRLGEPLAVEGAVSSQLLAGVEEIQRVWCTWDRTLRLRHPWYRQIEVVPEETHSPRGSPGRGTAAFFTGGVDSFATAVAHRDRLDALIFVHGFDVSLDDERLRSEVATRLRAAAEALGLPLLEVSAALPPLGESYGVGWPDYHGAALATVAHLFAGHFREVLIPATHTYAHLEGLGSHPLLDRCWSSERLRITHDGADANRVDKLRRIAEVPAARAHLRVCWENRDGAYNCGRCEKCLRTGVAARIAGLEGAFRGIPSPSLRQIAGVRATGRGSTWSELRDELERLDANPRLRRTIELVLARHQLARWRPTARWFR